MKKLINLTGLASPHLSRKFTYLLMLLVSLIWSTGTAWADTTLFSLTASNNGSDWGGSGNNITLNTDHLVTETHATITGGSAYFHQGADQQKIFGSDSSERHFRFTKDDQYMKLSLTTPLAVGDVVRFESNCSYQYVLSASSAKGTITTTNKSYTITSIDGLSGISDLYIFRNGSNNTYIKTITITRSETPGKTPLSGGHIYEKIYLGKGGNTFTPSTDVSYLKITKDGSAAVYNTDYTMSYALTSGDSYITLNNNNGAATSTNILGESTVTATVTPTDAISGTYSGFTFPFIYVVTDRKSVNTGVNGLTALDKAWTWTPEDVANKRYYQDYHAGDGVNDFIFVKSSDTSNSGIRAKLQANSQIAFKLGAKMDVTISSNKASGRHLVISTNDDASHVTQSGNDNVESHTFTLEAGTYYIGAQKTDKSVTQLYVKSIQFTPHVDKLSADFTYGYTSWTSPATDEMTITIPAHKAGQNFNVTVTPEDDATASCTSGGTLNGNILTITAPAQGVSNQTTVVEVTKNAVTTTYNIKVSTETKTGITFDPTERYSKLVINANIGSFYGNTALKGFNTYDENGGNKVTASWKKSNGENDTQGIDYVAGLVAKSIIEAADYYKTTDEANAKKWYYSIADYGNTITVPTDGGSLDDLNASKLFFTLYDLTKEGGAFNGLSNASSVNSTAITKLGYALSGLSAHNTKYSFGSSESGYTGSTTIGDTNLTGGWFHKSSYKYQMWCDGAYMGPALLAQLNNYNQKINNSGDWDLITKQFTLTWDQLWNSTDKLLYHAFTSKRDVDSYTNTWAGDAERTKLLKNSDVYHSASYWGRADGWYFLALIDVLEQMKKAGVDGTTNYNTLKGYAESLAAGLKARQDATTGCWYQLLDKDGTYSATDCGNGAHSTRVYNYLESSATAIFTAAYLKGIRLGILSKSTYEDTAKKAYEGLVKYFMTSDYKLYWTSRSAGLGGAASGAKLRDGSNAYYLKGYDVYPTKVSDTGSEKDETKTTTLRNGTEGKTLGAFIMAATEYERAYLEEPTASNDATLSDIRLKEGTLTPAFNKDIHLYTVNTKCDSKWLDASYVTKSDANAQVEFPNNAGKGTQTITVTAADGVTKEEYHLVFLAPNDWNETFTSTNYSNANPVTLLTDEVAAIGATNYNAVKINDKAVNQRFVVQDGTIWQMRNDLNFYSSNSGDRNFGVLNCKKNQLITIVDNADMTITTNAELVSTDNHTRVYRVLNEGNVYFHIARNCKIESITINDPAKVVFTATAGSNGSIAITADGNAITSGSEVEVGAKIVVTATPADGYEAVWTKTAGNDGEEGVNTYTINSITEATTISAGFNAVEAAVTKTIYKYTLKSAENTANTDYSADALGTDGYIGGTATLGKAGWTDGKGYKCDANLGGTKYIKVTLASGLFQAGDKITITQEAASTGAFAKLAIGTSENSEYSSTSVASTKTEDFVYTITASDVLVGQSSFYINRGNTTSTYIKTVTIERTTGGSSKADSPLAIKSGSAYNNAGNGWTPVVGGTIALTDIISSQSTGAYSITSGDAATLENGVLTAVKNGTITITQAADETFKAGTVDINVRIAADNTAAESTNYTVATDDVISDGMQVIRKNITMTYGNDNFWSKGSGSDGHGYITGGQKNPSVTNNIPLSGTFYKFEPTKNGTITIDTKIGADKPIYVSEDGTLIAATANGETVGNGKTLDANYSGNLVFDVKAGKTYYYYLMGSKAGLYGFSFADAVTITTQPVQPEKAYKQNDVATALTVVAEASSTNGTLSYQWYRSAKADLSDPTTLSDGNAASFTPLTNDVNTRFYYCVVTEDGGKTVASDAVKVITSEVISPATLTPGNGSNIVVGTDISATWTAGKTLYARWSSSDAQSWSTPSDFTETNRVGTSGAGTLKRTQLNDQYVYTIVVDEETGAYSEVTKTHYTIKAEKPTVVTQPINQSVLVGENVTLSVVGGNGADTYQWVVCDDAQKTNGVNISGATLPSYTPPTTELGTKYYYCRVINSKFTDDPSGTRNFDESSVATVEVTNKIGNDDKTTSFLGDIKGDKILYPGQSVNYKFVNTNGLSDDKLKNFVIAIKGANNKTNQVNLYANGMAHFYDTEHRHIQDGFSINPSDAISSVDFNTEMNGASVDVTVAYSPEKVVTMTANIITSTGKVWTYTYNSQTGGFTYTADAITAALSVDHAQLTMQDNASDLNVQETALVPNKESITIPYSTSSNGEVSVTTNKTNLTATVNPTAKTITFTSTGDATGMVGVTVWQKNGSGTTDVYDEEGHKTGEETLFYLAGVKTMQVTITKNENNDVSLATLSVNGQSIEVVADQTEYSAKSPSKVVPTVTATATNTTAEVTVTQADAVDGTATIRVKTSTTQKDYTVKFTPSAETPKDKVHWVLDGKAQVSNNYAKIPEYAADTKGNIYQMIHKGANGDYYGSFLYLGGETSNVNREISFKGISGKGRVIINTRKSSDAKVGSTIQIKDAVGNVVATGTYVNQTSCATTIFTYDANQTYTVNINGRAYILSMDYVPCREDILYVEENGQRYTMTKQAESEDDYFCANTSAWTNRSINGTKYDVFNLNGTGRSLTLNVNGAQAFEIITSNGNSSPRGYTVKIGDGAAISKTAPGSATSSSGIIPTGNTGDIKITITGASDGTVYPFQVIFYSEEPEASLNTSALSVKVEKTINVALASASTGAISMTGNSDDTVATASFNSDSKVLTLTGQKEGTTQLTFNVGGDNTYKDAVATIDVTVEKQTLKLVYNPEKYTYNVDTEVETGTLNPTLTVTDEDDNIVPLNTLNITYYSDDTSIATVDASGKITKKGTGQGSADIVATLEENETYNISFAVFTVLIEQGYSTKIDSDTKFGEGNDQDNPSVGETLELKNGNNETLVYATFGGWKWGSNGEKNDHKYDLNGSTKSDAWGTPLKYTGTGGSKPTYVDGYAYAISGKTDAMDETKTPSAEAIFGKTRNGWFQSMTTDMHIKPFTLPVRGAYMTFEPQQNGMLTVYLLQNGGFNSSTASDGTSKVIPGEFQPHSFHVVDQNGTALSDYTEFDFVVKEQVTQLYGGNPIVCGYTGQTEPGVFNNNDVATWPMFYSNFTPDERAAIKNAWDLGAEKGNREHVVKLHDGSFFIPQKAYVKYTFYVAASQTYYMFSNFSKMGFAGMNFVPDEDQPDQENDVLALNDEASFPELKQASANVSSNLSIPQYGKITVNRNFTAGKWSSICLPFDMTEREVENVFGPGTQLMIFDGFEDAGNSATVHFVYHEIQSILAGYPYMIKPTNAVTDGFAVYNKLIQPKNSGNPQKQIFNYSEPKDLTTFAASRYWCGSPYVAEPESPIYTFTGNYNSTTISKGDIYMSGSGNGEWKRYMGAATPALNGYRACIKYTGATDELDAKPLAFSFNGIIDNFDDSATGIEDIIVTDEYDNDPVKKYAEGIYNLNGQKMNTKNLPKGIYIINGQKYNIK